MAFKAVKNPGRGILAKMTADNGSFRAICDPSTGNIYAWPANNALHVDMVNKLNLSFKTRNELQHNSFLFSRKQLDQMPNACDLNDLVKLLGTIPGDR